MRLVFGIFIALFVAGAARGQSCPELKGPNAGEAANSTLHGTLAIYTIPHKWLGVKLDAPACDEQNLQLIFNSGDQFRQVKSLLGCKVTVTGELYKRDTEEYWTKLAMDDAEVKPDESCKPAPVELDPMKVPIPETLKSYTVTMRANTRYDSPFAVRVWTKNEQGTVVVLEPDAKYVNYGIMVTAGYVLAVKCTTGFVASDFTENEQQVFPLKGSLGLFPNEQVFGLKENAKEVFEFKCERK